METLGEVPKWAYIVIVGLYLFGLAAGLSAIFVDWLRQPPEPTVDDVRYAAEQYRTYYGTEANSAIGDHCMAATFARDGHHRRFLKRVAMELMRK